MNIGLVEILRLYMYMFYFYNLFSKNKIVVFNTPPNISSNKLINERKLTDLWCVLYVFLFYFNHRCSSEVLCIYIYISMKQPLMIYRDTGLFEMCPKFFLLKMKFKSTNTCNRCLYECPIYKQFLTSCWSCEVSNKKPIYIFCPNSGERFASNKVSWSTTPIIQR